MSTVLERPVTHRQQRDQEAPRTAEAPTAPGPVGDGEAVPVASRATWAATSSAGASTLTTAGLQFGTAGVVTTLVLGAGGAAGVAVLRRFAPATAARWGLHRQTGGQRSTPSRSRGSNTGAGGRRGGGPLSGGGAGSAGRGRGLLAET
ncbi:MAG: hypothetical protein ACRDQG_00465, partial [Pseudonocardiaceae bacterium]